MLQDIECEIPARQKGLRLAGAIAEALSTIGYFEEHAYEVVLNGANPRDRHVALRATQKEIDRGKRRRTMSHHRVRGTGNAVT